MTNLEFMATKRQMFRNMSDVTGAERRAQIIDILEFCKQKYPNTEFTHSSGIVVNREGHMNTQNDPDLKYLLNKGKIVQRRTKPDQRPNGSRLSYITLP